MHSGLVEDILHIAKEKNWNMFTINLTATEVGMEVFHFDQEKQVKGFIILLYTGSSMMVKKFIKEETYFKEVKKRLLDY